MNGDESLYKVNLDDVTFEELQPTPAHAVAIKEKKIEEWVVNHPGVLFTDDNAVMVIAQEVSGEAQADVLAVDSQGNLIIVEIKRHWSDRSTIGQLLDYAARLSEWGYEQFNDRWQQYKGNEAGDLFDAFREFIENPAFEKDDFLKQRRLYILAAEQDESMKRIIRWLDSEYNVPIGFVPFGLMKLGDDMFLKIQKIDVEPIVPTAVWAGDWFFNSDETHAPGAYAKMLEQGVIAACGYGHTKTRHKMALPGKGERVFMFVNRIGIVAAGEVTEDEPVQAMTVFGTEGDDEYHRKVKWLYTVPNDSAVTTTESSQWGYNLPIRCTIGRMSSGKVAGIIGHELKKRSKGVTSQS